MQFRIPQFLDIEDKVFGPLTVKQFGYTVGAIAFAYIFWKLIPYRIIAIFFIFIFSGTFLGLAFAKINSRPFADVLESAYKFILSNKMYIWRQEKKIEKEEDFELKKHKNENIIINTENTHEKITLEKLKELGDNLDILDKRKGKINLREELLRRGGKYQI